MKFSKSWVDEWIQAKIGTAEMAEQITMAGLEVDSMDPVAGLFSNVGVGEVI